MRTHSLIILIAAAGLILSACDRTGLTASEQGKAGAPLNIRSAIIAAEEVILVKSPEDNLPIPVLEDEDSGTSLFITTTVCPIAGGAPSTRATETTTATLSSFTVDGFLGDEIETCSQAEPGDILNRHFIPGATASKGADNYWHFGSTYQWRSCVDHHFWAYDGTPESLTISGADYDQASFTYTNSGDEDLIMAYQHQMWVDEKDSNGNWPLTDLHFRHALSEIVIDCSQIVLKEFNVNGGTETAPAERLRIDNVQILTPTIGTCSVEVGSSGAEFDWTCPIIVGDEVEGLAPLGCTGSDNSIFVIPQDVKYNVILLNVYDGWRDVMTPIFVEFPTSAVSEWQPGYKYTYQLTGTLCAPYFTNLGELNPNFSGKNFQQFAVLKNLLSKYVRKIEVSWTGLPSVNSNDTPCGMIYTPSSEGAPTSTNYPMNSMSDITADGWYREDNVGFVAATSHQVAIEPIKGTITNSLNPATGCQCEAVFIVPDDVDPPITFYLLYDGDNNGNANWVLHNMVIEVTEFKLPVHIL